MVTTPEEQNPSDEKSEDNGDKDEGTFPASAPPSTGGTTRIESEDGEAADEDEPQDDDTPE